MVAIRWLGNEFSSEKERNQYAFLNKDVLSERHSHWGAKGFWIGIIAGSVIAAEAGSFLAFIGILFGSLALFANLSKQKLKAIAAYAEMHEQHLSKLEEKLKDAYLAPFYARYQNQDILAHVPTLTKLLRLKGHTVTNEETIVLLKIYETEKNHAVFRAAIKGLRHDPKSLARAFVKTSRTPMESIDTFYEFLEAEGIEFQPEEISDAITEVLDEISAQELEMKLQRNPEYKPSAKELTALGGYEFEEFCKDLFQRLGYSVVITKKSGDQGADLIIKKDNLSTAVQAKQYSGKVGNGAVQEIIGAIKYYDCDRGMVITTADFTAAAVELAHINNIQLINRTGLLKLIDDAY